jgi:hypothetical protein
VTAAHRGRTRITGEIMNSYYGPQNAQYGYASNYGYAPAPAPMYVQAAPQNSGSGMKIAAGALALLAVGIAAFVLVLGMKKSEATTSAQSTPSTVFNIPSEISIPSLQGSTTSAAPVVVNNPAPRVITVPGSVQQAPVQVPVQQAPAQQAPVQQSTGGSQAADQAQKEAQDKAAQEAAAKKAAQDAADAKAENVKKAAGLKAVAAGKRTAANDARVNATLLLPGTPERAAAEAQADALDAEAANLEAQAAALEG